MLIKIIIVLFLFYMGYNLYLIYKMSAFFDNIIEYCAEKYNYSRNKFLYFIVLLFSASIIFGGNVKSALNSGKLYKCDKTLRETLDEMEKDGDI